MRISPPTDTRFRVFSAFSRAGLKGKIVSLLLGTVCIFTHGITDSLAASDEEALFSDIPIVLTATRLKQRIEKSPVSVTLIDRALIDASGVVSFADIFRLVPGFVVSRPRGGTTAVTPHGASSKEPRRLEVQVDGRSVYLPSQSSVTWSVIGISLDDVERIEVIRGPSSPAHGSNAFKGVINIITREPFLDKGTALGVTFDNNGEYKQYRLRHGGNLGDLDYRLSLGYQADDGFEPSDDSLRMNTLNFRGSYQPNLNDTIDIQLGYNNGNEGLSTAGTSTNPKRDRNIYSNFQKLSWHHAQSNDEEISVSFYHNYHKEDDRYELGLLSSLLGVPSALIPLGYPGHTDEVIYNGVYNWTSERYDLELENITKPNDNTRLVWGIGIRQDRLKSQYLLTHGDYIEDVSERVFANLEWNISDATTLNIGNMLEHNDTNSTLASPRLALNHTLQPGHAIRGSITRGFRALSLLEANFNSNIQFADGTPIDLQIITQSPPLPEKITSWELGYIGQHPKYNLHYDFKFFIEDIENGVAQHTDSVLGARVVDNDSEVDVKGLELQLRWEPSKTSLVHFTYATTKQDAWRNRDNSSYESLNNSVPDDMASLLLSHIFASQIQLSTTIHYMDHLEWIGADPIENYTRLDVRVAKKFQLGEQTAEIALLGHNLLGDYEEYDTTNIFDTKYFIQAKLNFH